MVKARLALLLLVVLLVSLVPVPVQAQEFELVDLRTETSKTYDLGGGARRIEISTGPIHYKDNYWDPNEPWKDIDTTIVNGRVTKAPYELTINVTNRSFTVRDKATGEITTIRLDFLSTKAAPQAQVALSTHKPTTIGNKVIWSNIAGGIDSVIEVGGTWVKFSRVIRNEHAAQLATFTVEGKNVIYRAYDKEGMPVEVQTTKIGSSVSEAFTARPDQYPITIDPTWQITASTDDAGGRNYYSYFDTAWTVNPAGGDDPTIGYYCGLRYLNIAIAQGATITGAYITFTCGIAGHSGTGIKTRFSADDTDDAATFSTSDNYSARWTARTTARVDWDAPALTAWVVNSTYQSPELKTIVQEIVDRGGWVSGNDMVIFWEDKEERSVVAANNRRYAYTYDSDSAQTPVLSITVGGNPSVTTDDPTDWTSSTGTLHGNVTTIGDTNIGERGFDWDTDSGEPYANEWTEIGTFGVGVFSHELTGLPGGMTIYHRAKAENDASIWGYGAEKSFTTIPDAPGNFTATSLGGSLVALNWTAATGADTTLIVGKSGSYPTDREDGWVAYNSSAANTTDNRGFSWDLENPYWRAWSYNGTSGFSTDYAQTNIGGEGMNNLTSFLVFPGIIGMSLFFIAIIPRKKNLLLSLGAAIFWFAMFFWWMKGEALQGLGFEGDVIIYLSYIPLIFFFVILLEYTISCNKAEIKRVVGGKEWTDWGTPPDEKMPTRAQDYRKTLHKRIR